MRLITAWQHVLHAATRNYCLTGAFLLAAVLYGDAAQAQGNLLVNPRRVVFEGSKRFIELNIANTGTDTANYAISLINIRMTKEGSFEIITTPDTGQLFANDYVRFFPKRVRLAPNEAQIVKVQLTQYNQLQPGEYRSHLYFRAVPNEKPLEASKPDDSKDESISVKLNAVFGISIPLIIRVGEPSMKVTLTDLAYSMVNDTTRILKMKINREGRMSAYGSLRIDHISPGGDAINVCEVRGIAVYTPNTERLFTASLQKKAGVDYHKGKLHVVFTSDIKSEKPFETDLELH